MAFGKKCRMGLVRSTSFGRKRVALSNVVMDFGGEFDGDCVLSSPLKRRCNQDSFLCSDKSPLEALPQDILIRILCGVEHDDLKRLIFVSKAISEATLIAKQWHFAYSTPRRTIGFKINVSLGEGNEVEAPKAPKQCRVPRSRLSAKKLDDLSVALFAIDDEPQGDLFMDMETEF